MHLDIAHLTHIERDLSDYLRPIDPDPGFIDTLSQRLSRSDRTILDRTYPHRKFLSVLGLGFLIGLIILLVLGERPKR